MNDVFLTLAIGISVSLMFAVVLGFISFMRWLRYKETIELAQRGLIKPKRGGDQPLSRTYRTGIIISAVGIAMTCGLATIGFEDGSPIIGPWLIGGLIPLSIGLAMVYISGRGNSAESSDQEYPIPPHKL